MVNLSLVTTPTSGTGRTVCRARRLCSGRRSFPRHPACPIRNTLSNMAQYCGTLILVHTGMRPSCCRHRLRNLPQNLRSSGCLTCATIAARFLMMMRLTLWPRQQLPWGQGHKPQVHGLVHSLSRANGGGASASTVTFAQQTCPASSTSSSSSSNDDNDGVGAYNGNGGNDDGNDGVGAYNGDGTDDGGYYLAANNDNTGQANAVGSAYEFNSAQLAGVIVGSCLAGMLIVVVVLKRDAPGHECAVQAMTGTPAASASSAPNSNPAYGGWPARLTLRHKCAVSCKL